MRRTGLGRRGGLDDAAGDPLDGLVNLFDVGIVLAVAFLLAGLGLTRGAGRTPAPRTPQAAERPLPAPVSRTPASGRGAAVGTVYRLADGRLVYVERTAAGHAYAGATVAASALSSAHTASKR